MKTAFSRLAKPILHTLLVLLFALPLVAGAFFRFQPSSTLQNAQDSLGLIPAHQTVLAQEGGVDWDAGETATTSPKIRNVTVSLSLSDSTPPTVPILVSPPHQSVLVTSIFPFIWKESTDDFGMQKYQLFLNGELLYDNIQPSHTTGQYTTTQSGDQITLMPVAGLADGSYTWKIRAVDIYDNYADSATWSFTIDTTAPILIITQIGEQPVSISSQDSTTVPTNPVTITTNPATLVGTTEPGASIQLSITIPGEASITLTTTADGTGAYEFVLPKLPTEVIILLQLIAQDSAGNTSVITDVPILIQKVVVTFPPPFDEILPEIPVPDFEVIEEIREEIREIIDRIPIVLPEPLLPLYEIARPIQNVPWLALFPVVFFGQSLWFAKIGGGLLSPLLTFRTLESIGLWFGYLIPPFRHPPKGIVFDIETHQGVPHVHLQLWRQDPELDKPVFVDERVSDSDGLYRAFEVEISTRSPETFLTEYFLTVTHRTHIFSSKLAQTVFRPFEEVYVGEYFSPAIMKHAFILRGRERQLKGSQPAENAEKLGLVPWLPMAQQNRVDWLIEEAEKRQLAPANSPSIGETEAQENDKAKQQLGKAQILRVSTVGIATLTAIGGVIAWVYPNPWNIGVLLLYIFASIRKVTRRYMPGFVPASRGESPEKTISAQSP